MAGCVESVPVAFAVDAQPLVPVPSATAGCEVDPVDLDCGPNEAGVTYEWDWDGDTTIDDVGCAVAPTLAAGAYSGEVIATTSSGCVESAPVSFTVEPLPLSPMPSAAQPLCR